MKKSQRTLINANRLCKLPVRHRLTVAYIEQLVQTYRETCNEKKNGFFVNEVRKEKSLEIQLSICSGHLSAKKNINNPNLSFTYEKLLTVVSSHAFF